MVYYYDEISERTPEKDSRMNEKNLLEIQNIKTNKKNCTKIQPITRHEIETMMRPRLFCARHTLTGCIFGHASTCPLKIRQIWEMSSHSIQ